MILCFSVGYFKRLVFSSFSFLYYIQLFLMHPRFSSKNQYSLSLTLFQFTYRKQFFFVQNTKVNIGSSCEILYQRIKQNLLRQIIWFETHQTFRPTFLANSQVVNFLFLANPQALKGCDDHCGNVSTPYPFSTRRECCLNEDFLITCNDTYYKPSLRSICFAGKPFVKIVFCIFQCLVAQKKPVNGKQSLVNGKP